MPELPEVETVVRSIAPRIVGQEIHSVTLSSRRVTRGDHLLTAAALSGNRILQVRRHGKQILVELERGLLYIHLGMTGNLLWDAERGPYSRAVFYLEKGILLFNDVRQFGRVEYYEGMPPSLSGVGPDALELDFPLFFSRLKTRKGPIKPLLLNQSFISGVGNIYADESLFAARIHPRTPARRLSKARAAKLYSHILEILQVAIQHRGSSISNHVDACGLPGSYQQMHSVYGRSGQACPCCGSAIKRIVLGQRGTHYCPRCQRA